MLWFTQVESQFVLRGITAQLTKFHHVLANLAQEIATEIGDLLVNPPTEILIMFSRRHSVRGPLSQNNGNYSSCLVLRILETRILLSCSEKYSSYSVIRLRPWTATLK